MSESNAAPTPAGAVPIESIPDTRIAPGVNTMPGLVPSAPPVGPLVPNSASGMAVPPDPSLPAETHAILNSSTLIVGPSQSGKSTLGATFAEYVWAKYRKVTLYYLIDGGGFPIQVQELVNRGIIRLWKVRTRSAPGLLIETLHRASQGWWPRKINARTGEAAPNVELVPPMTVTYLMKCPQGHEVASAPTSALLPFQASCPTCKTAVTMQNAQIARASKRTKGFEQVGAVFIDGISSSGSAIMDDLAQRELGGEKGAIGGIVGSGDMRFGSNNRAHYGFAQSRVEQMVLNSMTIPDLVIPPVWTALLQEGSDEGGLQVKGVLLPGQAKTAVATQWFGDTLETRLTEKDGKRVRCLHLSSWIESVPNGGQFRHICGVRSFPGRLPDVIEEVEKVDPPLSKFSLGYFYELRREVAEVIRREYAQKYADAPGLPEGDSEYGEAPSITGAGSAPASGAPSAPGRPAGMAPPPKTGQPLMPQPQAPPAGGAALAAPAGSPLAPSPSSTPAPAATPALAATTTAGATRPAGAAGGTPAGVAGKPASTPAPRSRTRVSPALGVVTAPGGAAPTPMPPASGGQAAASPAAAAIAPAPAGAGAEIASLPPATTTTAELPTQSGAAAPVPALLPATSTEPTLPGVPSAVLAGPAMAPAPPPAMAPSAPVRSAVPPPPGRRPQ